MMQVGQFNIQCEKFMKVPVRPMGGRAAITVRFQSFLPCSVPDVKRWPLQLWQFRNVEECCKAPMHQVILGWPDPGIGSSTINQTLVFCESGPTYAANCHPVASKFFGFPLVGKSADLSIKVMFCSPSRIRRLSYKAAAN